MMQAALTLQLTPNVCGYDPFAAGMEGAAEEIYHCAFPGARVTWTTDMKEALSGASYIVSSGGAPRKEGMTREDLLKGNAAIAAQLGKDIRECCPEVKLVVVIFNPADITGLTTLVHSGLPSGRVATLAALDSTRLQTALSQHFGVPQDAVTGCRTYGGHGEQMAVFASTAKIDGKPLTELIGTDALTEAQWQDIKQRVCQGGKRIIELRGRSSFQSPAHQSLMMVRSAMYRRALSLAGRHVREPGRVLADHDGHGNRIGTRRCELSNPVGDGRGIGRAARVVRTLGQAARRSDSDGGPAAAGSVESSEYQSLRWLARVGCRRTRDTISCGARHRFGCV